MQLTFHTIDFGPRLFQTVNETSTVNNAGSKERVQSLYQRFLLNVLNNDNLFHMNQKIVHKDLNLIMEKRR